MVRQIFVFIHRWAGLLMTVFLILVGLTGSVIAFMSELEHLISPQLYARPRAGVERLDLATLAERAETLVPQARMNSIAIDGPDQVDVRYIPRTDPATGKPYELDFTQFFVDPWTGKELGRRNFGDLSQGSINLIPFIYELHWTLALGRTGIWIMGVVALIWTIDCFIGFYLTLPISTTQFWRRWRPSWLIKRRTGLYRLNFDLHRASGLWLWPMLFVFAWSSVMLNLPSIYDWATGMVLDYQSPTEAYLARTPHPNETPRLDWHQALAVGERLIAEQAASRGFLVERARALGYDADQGVYFYYVKSNRDVNEKNGRSGVLFDGDTGAFRSLDLPSGEHSGGTVSTWLRALHMADVFGLPYRIFVCALGLVITMLSVTGVYIWWKKRKARIHANSRSASATTPLAHQT